MQPNPHERALAVFDAFLRYAREGRAPSIVPGRPGTGSAKKAGSATHPAAIAPVAPPKPPVDLEETNSIVIDPALSAGSSVATLESEAAPSEEEFEEIALDEQTDPNLASVGVASPTADADGFEDIPTRQSHLSEAIASTTAPRTDAVWDEPTRERLDVVREFLQQPPPPEPATFKRIPDPAHHEKSIIVDEDAAMTEPVTGDELRAVRNEANRIDTFVSEMTVLIKYGHASQVPREIERWLRANPDDLRGAFRLAEFERTRVEAAQGLDRLFWLASRALDRGDREVASKVLEVVQREAANDLRRSALEDRVGNE